MPIRKITLERAATDKPRLGGDFIDSSFALDSSEALSLLGVNSPEYAGPRLGTHFVDSAEAKKLISGNKGLSYNNVTGELNVDSNNILSFTKTSLAGNKGLTYTSGTGTFDIDSNNIKAMFAGNKGLTFTSGTFDVDSTNIISFTRSSLSGNKGLSYDPSTGEFNIDSSNIASTIVTNTINAAFINALSGVDADTLDGQGGSHYLDYNNFTNKPSIPTLGNSTPGLSFVDSGEARKLIAGNKGLSYNNVTGEMNIDSSNVQTIIDNRLSGGSVSNVQITGYLRGPASFTIDPAAHGDNTGTVVIAGNLTVNGTTTTVSSETVTIADNIIVLNSNETGTPSQNAGIEVERGTSTNASIRWNETSDYWEVSDGAGNFSQIGDILSVNISAGTGLTGTQNTLSGAHAQTIAVDVGTGANKIVQLDGNAKLPAIDGSQLTNLPSGATDFVGLTDTPTSLSGAASKLVKVNSGASALEFVTDTTLIDGDFPVAGLMKTDGAGSYSSISDNSTNWDTAFGWGNHGAAGYLTSQTSHADVLVDGDFASAGLMKTNGSGTYSIVTDNSTNWDTAFGWGNHATAGYATGTIPTLGNNFVDSAEAAKIPETEFSVTTANGGVYKFTGDGFPVQSGNNPHIYMQRGKKYVINNSSYSAHPLYIKTAQGTGTGNQYTSGVTGQGTVKVTFEVPMDAPQMLYYQCSLHSAMHGKIFILSELMSPDSAGVTTLANAAADTRIAASSINALTDVNTAGASTGEVLKWSGSAWTPQADATGGTTYTNADVDAHLNQSNPSSGHVLSWNGSDYAWVSNAGYTNADVDTHLNQSNPTAGYVLSWNGSDYAWVSNATGGGGSMNDVIDDTTPQLGGNLDLNSRDITGTGNINITGNATFSGNLTVNGTTTTVNTTELTISDNIITLNNDETGTPSQNAGIAVERGTSTNVDIRWNESTDKWQFTNDGATYYDIPTSGGGGGSLSNVVEDTTPQLGGSLDVNGQKIVSVSGGDIDIEPDGTGDVLLGNFKFDADQTVGSGQDNYVLTYDHSGGKISLEAASGGGSAITIKEEGSALSTAATSLNFVGAAVTASGTGGDKTITIGTTLATGNIAETFTGNGSDTAFTLTNSFTTNSAVVFYNGQHLTPTSDYAISGQTLTFTFTPVNGSELVVRNINAGRTKVDTFTANGSDTAFTTTNVYSKIEEIMVFVNGSLLVPTTDYTFSAPSTVTFTFTPTNNSEIAVRGSGENAILANRFTYVATASQTVFSGNDAGGATMAFTADNIDVYLNGSKLSKQQNDYSVSGGNTVTLAVGAALSDVLEVVVMDPYETANVLQTTNNLSDLTNATTARTNLDVISITSLKSLVAASTDFADFKSRIAAL